MKTKIEVLEDVKKFAKEFGAPDAIISDAAREQKSQDMSKFLNELSTTLRTLEEGTPRAKKYELYIGIIKQLM